MKNRDFKTVKFHGVYGVEARCDDCGWTANSKNGVGLAAKHHYLTGHTVHVETESGLTFTKENSEWHQNWESNHRR